MLGDKRSVRLFIIYDPASFTSFRKNVYADFGLKRKYIIKPTAIVISTSMIEEKLEEKINPTPIIMPAIANSLP